AALGIRSEKRKGAPAPSEAEGALRPPPLPERPRPVVVRVIERDLSLARLIAYCLGKEGFRATTDASEGTATVVVVGEPEAVEAARGYATEAVIIAFYAERAPEAGVRALELGADVALTRPLEPEILFAHVRAAARRSSKPCFSVDA
ncbi:MAG: response regulator transcription factor, partial [Planctomycetia bacterium]|nr:response regulator transcription factor [Planctomycetia bacterium]